MSLHFAFRGGFQNQRGRSGGGVAGFGRGLQALCIVALELYVGECLDDSGLGGLGGGDSRSQQKCRSSECENSGHREILSRNLKLKNQFQIQSSGVRVWP